jgi:DNA-binding CsgD family transcriptional regulator
VAIKIIYGFVTLISLLLIIGYWNLIKKKDTWFILLFVAVLVVNGGYLSMSLSGTVEEALLANRFSYLGSVLLPLCMMMIIMNVCKIKYPKYATFILFTVSVIVFIIAASGGYTDWYYKDVQIEFIDGAAKLVKEYGTLHAIYYVYLFAYLIAMACMIVYATIRKKAFSWPHASLLLCATFGNIVIWLVEQLINVNFEFLSVSYIITELFLLLLYGLLQEHGVLDDLGIANKMMMFMKDNSINIEYLMANHPELQNLTARELEVLKPLLEDKKRKDIADELSVTEHTIKKHTAHIFAKMEVASRKELAEKLGLNN